MSLARWTGLLGITIVLLAARPWSGRADVDVGGALDALDTLETQLKNADALADGACAAARVTPVAGALDALGAPFDAAVSKVSGVAAQAKAALTLALSQARRDESNLAALGRQQGDLGTAIVAAELRARNAPGEAEFLKQAIQDSIKQIEARNGDLNTQLAGLQARLGTAGGDEKAHLQASIDAIRAQKTELVADHAAARARLANVDATTAAAVAAANQQATALRAQKAALDAEVATAQQTRDDSRRASRRAERASDRANEFYAGATLVRNRVRGCIEARRRELEGRSQTVPADDGSPPRPLDWDAINRASTDFQGPDGSRSGPTGAIQQPDAYRGTGGGPAPAGQGTGGPGYPLPPGGTLQGASSGRPTWQQLVPPDPGPSQRRSRTPQQPCASGGTQGGGTNCHKEPDGSTHCD